MCVGTYMNVMVHYLIYIHVTLKTNESQNDKSKPSLTHIRQANFPHIEMIEVVEVPQS